MPFKDPWHTRPTDEPLTEESADARSANPPRRRRVLPDVLEGVIELVLEIAAAIIDALT